MEAEPHKIAPGDVLHIWNENVFLHLEEPLALFDLEPEFVGIIAYWYTSKSVT